MTYSAHIDTFTRDNLPPAEQLPEFLFDLPELQFPERLNCADPLLDDHVVQGRGGRVCIQAPGLRWTYADLQERANRIANVLVRDMGLVPGNRVLLRAPNNPMMAACWFAVMKAGAVAVATMPLLRAKELRHVIAKAKVTHALCDLRLAEELKLAAAESSQLKHVLYFNDSSATGLDAAMARQSTAFSNIDTALTDTCILAFTSGTTGQPKATMHFHRDVMASCVCWPPHVLRPTPDDIFMGTPPLAFTFGLGGLAVFPLRFGAAAALLEQATPTNMIELIQTHKATVCFTAPTAYRVMLKAMSEGADLSSLRALFLAGEPLDEPTAQWISEGLDKPIIDNYWQTETGWPILGIANGVEKKASRFGSPGVAMYGYNVKLIDESTGEELTGADQKGVVAIEGPLPPGCMQTIWQDDARFVKTYWQSIPGKLVYSTFDWGVRDKDGY